MKMVLRLLSHLVYDELEKNAKLEKLKLSQIL